MPTLKLPRSRGKRLLVALSVLGPGLIAAAAGNEAGGIVTYSSIGAAHGYSMLWLLLLSTFSLVVTQEMGARMGVVTGKGLADLIREEFGVRVAVFAMGVLFFANLATTVAEFAGIAAVIGTNLPPVVRGLLVLAIAGVLWVLVLRGSYRRMERVFLVLCAVYIVYVFAAYQSAPPWGSVFKAALQPQFPRHDRTYLPDAIALIGTTIAPWMQFYVQSSVRDKGLRPEDLRTEQVDVFIGSTLSNVISFFIIVTCAVKLFPTHGPDSPIETASQLAGSLNGLGKWGPWLFGIGLFNASIVGAVIVPLSTAYATTEAIGSESGLGRKVREAPLFIAVFTTLIVVAALIVAFTKEQQLLTLIKGAQICNGILLPVILVLMLRLVNRRRLMGRFVNGWGGNTIAWLTVAIVALLSIAYLLLTLIGR